MAFDESGEIYAGNTSFEFVTCATIYVVFNVRQKNG